MMKEQSSAFVDNTVVLKPTDLLWSVLRRWRNILIVMVIAAILIGGGGFLKSYKAYKDPKARETKQKEYEEALESYNLSVELYQTRIANLENKIAEMDMYSETSLLLQMDPYNVYKITKSYYIDSNYEIMPDVFYQNPDHTEALVKGYRWAIDRLNFEDLIDFPGEADLTTKHPILDQSGKTVYSTSGDTNTGILTIRVFGDSEKRARQILAAIDAEIERQKVVLTAAIGEHSVSVLNEGAEIVIDTELITLQDTFSSEYESALNSLEKAQTKLNDLQKPTKPTYSRTSVFKDGIKYGIIGLFIGLFGAVIWHLLPLCGWNKLINVEDIRNRYRQNVLGTLQVTAKKQNKIDRWIAGKLGIIADQSQEEAAEYILENVQLGFADKEKLLVIGSVGEEKITALCDLLNAKSTSVSFVPGGDVNKSSAALKAISGEKAVIVAEEWQKSEHRSVSHEIDKLALASVENTGFIVLY